MNRTAGSGGETVSYTLQQSWLPCGCRRGFFLCAEARALWATVEAAYRAAALLKFGNWTAYTDARVAYERHFGYGSSGIESAMIGIPRTAPCP